MPSARRARTPPMPRINSWRSRCSTVAAVEPRRDGARPLRIAFDIGIEQIEMDAADLHFPDRQLERVIRIIERDLDQDRLAVVIQHLGRRLGPRFEIGGDILLPAVVVEPLAEISLPIEQRHRHQRQAEIARLLDVIAREHAETAGIDRQNRVQTELGGKIGKLLLGEIGTMAANPGRFRMACWSPHRSAR